MHQLQQQWVTEKQEEALLILELMQHSLFCLSEELQRFYLCAA